MDLGSFPNSFLCARPSPPRGCCVRAGPQWVRLAGPAPREIDGNSFQKQALPPERDWVRSRILSSVRAPSPRGCRRRCSPPEARRPAISSPVRMGAPEARRPAVGPAPSSVRRPISMCARFIPSVPFPETSHPRRAQPYGVSWQEAQQAPPPASADPGCPSPLYAQIPRIQTNSEAQLANPGTVSSGRPYGSRGGVRTIRREPPCVLATGDRAAAGFRPSSHAPPAPAGMRPSSRVTDGA